MNLGGDVMNRVKFAVIGTSMIADNFIEILDACAGAEYVGSMGLTLEDSQGATRAHGGSRAFADIDDIAACGEVDAVYIASPNAIHYGQALAMIKAGKHVMVEKPIASDAGKVEHLFELARERGVVAMEAMRPVHDPGIAKVKGLLDRIGTLRRATLRYGKYSSRYDELLAGSHTNIFDARLATGALMDLGIYCVEAMIALFGEPSSVHCDSILVSAGREELTGGPIDGAGSIIASFGDSYVTLAYSKITQDLLDCQIEGERGTITFTGVDGPKAGRIHIRGKAVRNAAKSTATSLGDFDEDIEFEQCENNMAFELDDFLACVSGEQDFERYAAISLASLRVMDAARAQCSIAFPMDGEL